MSEPQTPEGSAAEPAKPASSPPVLAASWGWPVILGALALAGILLAIADIALYGPSLGPFGAAMPGTPALSVTSPIPERIPNYERIDRSRVVRGFTFIAPIGFPGPISPVRGLRALLSNGAGLVFLALSALVLFPKQVRTAVGRLEDRHGPEVALAGGVVTLLLLLAAMLLLRFTLIFLALVPVVLVLALGTTLFGVACISLAAGRLLRRRLGLGDAHPLIAALAGALIVFDLAAIPYVGVVALAAVAIAGLGLAAVTRFGSATGWTFADLKW